MIYENQSVFYVQVDNKWHEKYNQLISLITEEKQERIGRYTFNIDKKLTLFADLLIRFLACESLNVMNQDLEFSKLQYGKPYLVNPCNFQYNVAHTRNAIVCATSDSEIGIDIEKIQKAEMQIAQRFFTKNELNYIQSNLNNQDELFYAIWTKKEAYIKWIGKGLLIPLRSFDVLEDRICSMIKTVQVKDYMISICSDKNFNSNNIIKLSEEHVYDMALSLLKSRSFFCMLTKLI